MLSLQISRSMIRQMNAASRFTALGNCRALHASQAVSTQLGTAPSTNKGAMLPSTHWTIERAVTASMLPMYPLAFIFDTPFMNFAAVSVVTLHAYWGLHEVIRDYVMERRYGPALQPLIQTIWKIICALGYAGMLYFNYNDVGVITAIKKLWAV